jgi:hypothetical protein
MFLIYQVGRLRDLEKSLFSPLPPTHWTFTGFPFLLLKGNLLDTLKLLRLYGLFRPLTACCIRTNYTLRRRSFALRQL